MEAVQYSMEWTLELNEILDGTKLTTKLFKQSKLEAIFILIEYIAFVKDLTELVLNNLTWNKSMQDFRYHNVISNENENVFILDQ